MIWAPIILIAAASLLKIVGGGLSGSLALVADGLDSMINVTTMSMAYYLHVRSKLPPDKEHRYGHWGLEDFSSLLLSLFLVGLGTLIIVLAILGAEHPHVVAEEAILYAVISTATLAASFTLFRVYGRRRGSVAILSESSHLAIDLVESLAVLCGVFLAVRFTHIYDVIVAMGVGVLMYLAALMNVRRLYGIVTHKMPDPLLEEALRKTALSVVGVKECHEVRAREMGGKLFIDLHLVIDGGVTVSEAHELAHAVERKIRNLIPNVEDVVVHVEPG